MSLKNSIDDDIHVRVFARVLRTLDPHPPISDQYEQDAGQKQRVRWSSQREHMVGWFSDQTTLGSGAYTRTQPNASARTTYNRLLSPGGVIWIAEALGEDRAVVQAAADAARAEPNVRKRPALLRRHLPWSRISELAKRVLG